MKSRKSLSSKSVDSQAPERERRPEREFPYHSGVETLSLMRKTAPRLAFLRPRIAAENVWLVTVWSSDRNRDPTFSAPRTKRHREESASRSPILPVWHTIRKGLRAKHVEMKECHVACSMCRRRRGVLTWPGGAQVPSVSSRAIGVAAGRAGASAIRQWCAARVDTIIGRCEPCRAGLSTQKTACSVLPHIRPGSNVNAENHQ